MLPGVAMATSATAASPSTHAARIAAPPARSTLRPIIFVHGGAGSGGQFETQAKRFASNGYPATYIETNDYDSGFYNNTLDQVYAELDRRIARLKAETGATQVDLLAHSLGTFVSQSYLKSTPERAASVAHYVNIDGAAADALPGGVPTLALWSLLNKTSTVTGATNIHLDNQTHVQTTSSVESFKAEYKFFTGSDPATTDVTPQSGPIRLAGRAVSFPSNVGLKQATLRVYQYDPETGKRITPRPVAAFRLGGDGSFGFIGSGTAYYEFAISHDHSPEVHHIYYFPFRRTDLDIKLLSTDPGTGVDLLIEHNAKHSAVLLYRDKEWWGDQGANNDTLTVNGTSVLNATTAGLKKLAIGIFAFDDKSDGVSNVDTLPAALAALSSIPFLSGTDIYIPASPGGSGTITLATTQRGGDGHVAKVVVPNWPSDTNLITVHFDDYI
jgi:pimeloyl-ACP methyl ester carboxylesterase